MDPPFGPLNAENPLQSIKDWGARCRQLIQIDESDLAGREGKLMVRMLPKPDDPCWRKLHTETEAEEVLESLGAIGEAIARASLGKDPATLQDIATVTALNYYVYGITKTVSAKPELLKPFAALAQQSMKDLLDMKVSLEDFRWLRGIRDAFDPGDITQSDYVALMQAVESKDTEIPSIMQPLINLSQYTAMALGTADASLMPPQKNPRFTIEVDYSDFHRSPYVTLSANRSWRITLEKSYSPSLHFRFSRVCQRSFAGNQQSIFNGVLLSGLHQGQLPELQRCA